MKIIITDLDGTLLHSDLTISERTKAAFELCRSKGILTAFATARAERAAQKYIDHIDPDIVISNGGSLVRYHEKIIFRKQLSAETARGIIDMCFELTGGSGEVTAETDEGYFWNYDTILNSDYSGSIYTDFSDFMLPVYKITASLENAEWAAKIAQRFPECETLNFRGEIWRRFGPKGADKESAIKALADSLEIDMSEIVAFGDDISDIGMLRAAGTGTAMGNALDEVKAAADIVTESNDNDGVAVFIENYFNKEGSV